MKNSINIQPSDETQQYKQVCLWAWWKSALISYKEIIQIR